MADDNSSSFSWFLAGLGIGSLIGVLYAPKSGYETREELKAGAIGKTEYAKQRAREVAGQANDLVERSKTQANEFVERGKAQATEYVGKGKEYVDVSRDKINDAVSQGKQLINEQTVKVQAAYEAGKQAYAETTVPPASTEGPLS
jgi:gas vesicle protein